jgi:hypothetical protein
MTNCVNLNLNIHPLKEGIDINSYGTAYIRPPLNDINHELISLLGTLNLTIVWISLFYTPPFHFTEIHTDVDDSAIRGDYTRLNYVFGGKNSLMNWWKPKLGILNIGKNTEIGSPYVGYDISEVDLVDTQQVKFPSIVQVGIPHNIQNLEEPRYCLSLVLRKQNNTRLTIAESLEIFKHYL